MDQITANTSRIVLVTGPSGAGRSSAINVLEDQGFEAIDNIPLSLIPRLIEGDGAQLRPMALGIDVRNRDFSTDGLLELRSILAGDTARSVDLLYLDCSTEVLARRYSETRRRHPLAPDETPTDGILREKAVLEELRGRADILIDTSELSIHDFKTEMEGWFAPADAQGMAVSVQSFSYKRGLPQGLDMVFDCRFLSNPHWVPDLRSHTGLDPEVARYVAADPRYSPFLEKVRDLSLLVLPACVEEGKAHFAIGFGCTGGKHRSVALAENLADALAQEGWRVSIRHRELERRGQPAAGPASYTGKASE
ncbi:RNase adapter RapZ [Ponticoccus alexandrii]|uniref:RNase adapter RapZ n=1 Tax=Ponticoccus alexandrii TaxID=1943633 RepID=A0ABX7F4E0_9RHOB|nr:RNase adapter RapZ [Ponticoccus alexandrii]KID12673.1 glmZ(sRNA)-inactivating NTPase [Rhodobacteraceae bacterium PD-2]QRF65162.1 RNase adapter RapZ [Ponticoccus alexandrii]